MNALAPTLRRDYLYNRVALALLFATSLLVPTKTLHAQGTSTRVESFSLQPGGEVRVENSRGSTRVEAWDGKAVRVLAEKKASGGAAIDPGELLLMGAGNSVFVECRDGASSGRIDLTIYMPRGSRLELNGGAWPVDVNGSLGGAIIETTSGNIGYRLPSMDDARVAMRSMQGVVRSTLVLTDTERDGTRSLSGRIGQGASEITLNSQTGNITLAPGVNTTTTRNQTVSRVDQTPARPAGDPRQTQSVDFDRPPLGSKQPDTPTRSELPDQIAVAEPDPNGSSPSDRPVYRSPGRTPSGSSSAVFAGSDVGDESTSASRAGKLQRDRRSKDTNSGNSGLRVKIIPGAIPSSGGTASIYDDPDAQDRDSTTLGSPGTTTNPRTQRGSSSQSGSGSGSSIFAGSDIGDDEATSAKAGPLERERKNRNTTGGNSGLRVRIIPADQALGGSSSSDRSIYEQRDDQSSADLAQTGRSRVDDDDKSSRSPGAGSVFDPPASRSSNDDANDELASRGKRSPVLHRDSGNSSSDESSWPRYGAGANSSDDTVVLKSALVNLNVSVTNRSGVAFGNLKKEDFQVAENGEPQKIEFFAPSTAPFNLVLLLDLSGSIKDKLDVVKSAALRFLDVIESQDRVAVVTFTDQIRVVSQLTADRDELKRRIRAIERPHGGTSFYEALWFSLQDTLRNSRGQRNAIVVMTDGVDSSLDRYNPAPTRVSFNRLAARLEESDTLVFPIYLDTEYEEVFERGNSTSEAYAIARDQLERIAEVSGGQLFKAERASDLGSVYKQVAAAIRTMYSVGYYPTNVEKDGTYRRVRVTVDKPDAAVRTRKGYYAK